MDELTQIKPAPRAYFRNSDGGKFTQPEAFNHALRSKSSETYDAWNFGAGDPEFFKYSDLLLVPGGKVLDLGCGELRASLSLAMRGMEVTGIDTRDVAIKYARWVASRLGLSDKIRAHKKDILEAKLPENAFDTVILSQTLNHCGSYEKAHQIIQKAISAVKPGGYLWFRGGGIYDSGVEELDWQSEINPYEFSKVEDGIYNAPCSCSGEWQIEPHMFVDPMQMLGFLAGNGMQIRHTQVIPQEGYPNILYGEDWQGGRYRELGGMVTIIAQKPLEQDAKIA